MKKKRKINKKMRRLIAFAILLLIIFFIIKTIIGLFFSNKEPKEISLLLNNSLVDLKNEIIVENDVLYLSKDDVENLFDKNIYYNTAEKELITTYNKHIALLKVDEKFMVVNDSNAELKSPMLEKNSQVYLPFSEMGIIYDLEFEYSDSNKRLIADSISNEKSVSLALKNVKLKKHPRLISGKIEKVSHGEYVNIIESASKKYYKVRTSRGEIGYIKKKKLSDPEMKREEWKTDQIQFEIIKDASNISKNYKKSKLSKDKQNVVTPHFFFLEKNGEILDKTASTTNEYKNYINWTKENNIEVWVTLENNVEVSNSLLNYTDRNKIINELYRKLIEYDFTGVNIDFTKIDDINSFYRFVIELTPRLKELGLKVAITKNETIEKNRIVNVVDLIIE